jgi:hypothetical protein
MVLSVYMNTKKIALLLLLVVVAMENVLDKNKTIKLRGL